MFQKQPFVDNLQSRCSWMIHKIHSKKPVLESLFNKVAFLKTCNFIKEDSNAVAFLWNLQNLLGTIILKNICECLLLNFIYKETPTQVFSHKFCKFFKNTYFVEDLRTAVSETPVRGSLFNKVASLTTWTAVSSNSHQLQH